MDQKEKLLSKLVEDESFISWICTNDDQKWSSWLAENPEMNDVVESARRVILSLNFNIAAPSKERIDFIKNSVEDNIILVENQSRAGSWLWNPLIRRAAVLLLLISVITTLYFALNNTFYSTADKDTVTYMEKSTHKGQKLTTNLPDGSKVTLNSNSKIFYTMHINEGERKVKLEGEAFFDVMPDKSRPFKVVSNGITTTALGTSFNIKSKTDDWVEVSLVSGKVSVRNEKDEVVVLNPGEMARANQFSEIEVGALDYSENIVWKDGILVFNNATFTEIIDKLEDWYGVDINVNAGAGKGFHYTAKYENHTLSEVLQGIAFVQHFEYSIEGDSVKINFKPTE